MKLIFPGMDPYLEAPGIWPGFHEAFLFCIREALQPVLPEHYYAELQTREEIGIGTLDQARVMYSDVAVRRTNAPDVDDVALRGAAVGLRSSVPETLVVVEEEPVHVSFLEIRDLSQGTRLVTLIELLSPSNKLPGPDRDAFERKQADVLSSDVHWVEIDLLRAGRRIGGHAMVEAHCRRKGYDYAVIVSSATRRSPHLQLELYGFGVRDPFPIVRVPLREPDPEAILDLGRVFRRAYETGPYRKILRYDRAADPPLSDGDAHWARELIEDHPSNTL